MHAHSTAKVLSNSRVGNSFHQVEPLDFSETEPGQLTVSLSALWGDKNNKLK